jgi:hypothetical protein
MITLFCIRSKLCEEEASNNNIETARGGVRGASLGDYLVVVQTCSTPPSRKSPLLVQKQSGTHGMDLCHSQMIIVTHY